MNIFFFLICAILAALVPCAAAGAVYWAALSDTKRMWEGQPARRWGRLSIRERRA